MMYNCVGWAIALARRAREASGARARRGDAIDARDGEMFVFLNVSQYVQSEEFGVEVAVDDAELARRRRRGRLRERGFERRARDAPTGGFDLGARADASVTKFCDERPVEETRVDDAQIEDGRGVDGGEKSPRALGDPSRSEIEIAQDAPRNWRERRRRRARVAIHEAVVFTSLVVTKRTERARQPRRRFVVDSRAMSSSSEEDEEIPYHDVQL